MATGLDELNNAFGSFAQITKRAAPVEVDLTKAAQVIAKSVASTRLTGEVPTALAIEPLSMTVDAVEKFLDTVTEDPISGRHFAPADAPGIEHFAKAMMCKGCGKPMMKGHTCKSASETPAAPAPAKKAQFEGIAEEMGQVDQVGRKKPFPVQPNQPESEFDAGVQSVDSLPNEGVGKAQKADDSDDGDEDMDDEDYTSKSKSKKAAPTSKDPDGDGDDDTDEEGDTDGDFAGQKSKKSKAKKTATRDDTMGTPDHIQTEDPNSTASDQFVSSAMRAKAKKEATRKDETQYTQRGSGPATDPQTDEMAYTAGSGRATDKDPKFQYTNHTPTGHDNDLTFDQPPQEGSTQKGVKKAMGAQDANESVDEEPTEEQEQPTKSKKVQKSAKPDEDFSEDVKWERDLAPKKVPTSKAERFTRGERPVPARRGASEMKKRFVDARERTWVSDDTKPNAKA